jgi:hypothetical protein
MAEKFIAALRSCNAAVLTSIMTDDVVWSLPGQSIMSGEAHGVEGIL